MIQDRTRALTLTAILVAAYVLAIFPSVFFRHDDWWILGNSVRYLPGDWSFAWKPMLYYGDEPIAWFFRPGFKFLVYAFYQCFGFHYLAWMTVLLSVFAATLALGYGAATRLTGSSRNGLWFVSALIASLTLHFGSLAWMGEGMMNVPQAFFLMLCTYAFVRGGQERGIWPLVGGAAFVVALCFKESSVFQTAFLAAVVCAEGPFTQRSVRERVWSLVPFAAIAALYLTLRFGAMPVTPSYVPDYTVDKFLRSLFLVTSPVLLPLALWMVWVSRAAGVRAYWLLVARRAFYLPFFFVSAGIFLGHDFFSPGWLLVIGTFTLLAFSFARLPAAVTASSIVAFAVTLAAVSAVPVVWRLDKIGWWHWQQSQRAVLAAVAAGPADTVELVVRACESPAYPGTSFERVVASEEGLRQMWFLTHGSPVVAKIFPCESIIPPGPGKFVLHWKFPAGLEPARAL